MKFIVQNGSVRIIYSNLENLNEDLAKIFRLLVYFNSYELVMNSTIYRVESSLHTN